MTIPSMRTLARARLSHINVAKVASRKKNCHKTQHDTEYCVRVRNAKPDFIIMAKYSKRVFIFMPFSCFVCVCVSVMLPCSVLHIYDFIKRAGRIIATDD